MSSFITVMIHEHEYESLLISGNHIYASLIPLSSSFPHQAISVIDNENLII